MRENVLVIVLRRAGALAQPLGGGDRMGELFASSRNLLSSLRKTMLSLHDSGFLKYSFEKSPEVSEVFVRDYKEAKYDERSTIVLNARYQFRNYVARNFKIMSKERGHEDVSDWTISRRIRDVASGARSIRTALDIMRKKIPSSTKTKWTQIETPTSNVIQIDSRYMDVLQKDDCEIVLFRGNHASPVLSKKCQGLIKEWQPDTVILETCSTRLDAMLFPPPFKSDVRVKAAAISTLCTVALIPDLTPFALLASYFVWMRRERADMRVALEASCTIGADVVLADWESKSRSYFDRIAREFDSVQYANQADTNGVVFWSALYVFFF